MKTLLSLFILVVSISVNAQDRYVKLSGGYMMFGTGDVQGYSVRVEYAKNLIKSSNARLFVGPELAFESGTKNPKVHNPTFEEFAGTTFYHISNTVLSAKASFYPFRRVIPGVCLTAAPSVGYSSSSTEQAASLEPYGYEVVRRSILTFDNGFVYGYRVGAGYDLEISNKCSAGILLELHNYNNGDFNSFWGANIAWRF
jgi:hypothetical protein